MARQWVRAENLVTLSQNTGGDVVFVLVRRGARAYIAHCKSRPRLTLVHSN